jgi:sulfur carrier protein
MMDAMVEAIIQVNGKSEALSAERLTALLADKGIDADARGVAVALNGAVVPRGAWAQTELRPGDAIEIVRAKQGG